MRNWFADRRGAWFFLLLGIGLIGLFVALERNFPEADQLESATGRVVWQQETREALSFALSSQQRLVLYAKGDNDGRQRAAVRDAALYPITVKFFCGQKAPPGVACTAYVVAVGGKEIASLEQVRGAYRRDNLVALLMGVLAAAAGAWRLRTLRTLGILGAASPAAYGKPASRRPR